MNQEILFIVPTAQGWAEITQREKVDQPLTLKFNNRRPSTEEEKIDLKQYGNSFHDLFSLKESENAFTFYDYIYAPETLEYEDPGFLACH